MKKALITGITGQDGSYLAELLIAKGYEVHGIIRRSSSFNTGRIEHIYEDPHKNGRKLVLHYGDLSDSSNINQIIGTVSPDEIYHLGAQSHVRVSFDMPEYTADIDALGTLRILEAIRATGKKIKFYQAGSSEMFGKVLETPQKETTPFYPRSPYACAKVFAHHISINYRESYEMFVCNGILFNHESPRRGGTFVTKKIVAGLVAIRLGKQKELFLGNLDAKRDWGYAKEYVEAMWLMMQHDTPDDYVIATGQTQTVRSFAQYVAKRLGYELVWEGEGLDEMGKDEHSGVPLIRIDPVYYRPTEVDLLLGDATKAKRVLGWEPKVTWAELADVMLRQELLDQGVDPQEYLV